MNFEVLAHRGLWADKEQQNTLSAIEEAWARGFGVETDLRDSRGNVVVSHDPPEEGVLEAVEVLSRYDALGCDSTLALNIKADGIGRLLTTKLALYDITNY